MSDLQYKNVMFQVTMFSVTFPSGSQFLTDLHPDKIEESLRQQDSNESGLGIEALVRADLREQFPDCFFFRVNGNDGAMSLSEKTGVFGWKVFTQEK